MIAYGGCSRMRAPRFPNLYSIGDSIARHMPSDPDIPGRTISAVAFACGFGDLSYFNRSFRRRYGMPPSDARKNGASRAKPASPCGKL